MLLGPYAPLFWFEIGVGHAVPFVILAIRPLRRNPAWVAIAAGHGIVGIFVHRLNLVLNGLSYANIQLPPGLPIGTDQGGATSFATSYWYVPTLVEWLVVSGCWPSGPWCSRSRSSSC